MFTHPTWKMTESLKIGPSKPRPGLGLIFPSPIWKVHGTLIDPILQGGSPPGFSTFPRWIPGTCWSIRNKSPSAASWKLLSNGHVGHWYIYVYIVYIIYANWICNSIFVNLTCRWWSYPIETKVSVCKNIYIYRMFIYLPIKWETFPDKVNQVRNHRLRLLFLFVCHPAARLRRFKKHPHPTPIVFPIITAGWNPTTWDRFAKKRL